jgi:hypothetical protein
MCSCACKLLMHPQGALHMGTVVYQLEYDAYWSKV